jgi:hypothetical protein
VKRSKVERPPKRSRLAEEALQEERERMAALGMPSWCGTDSSASWIEEENIINRAIARKKRAGQSGNPDRDMKMAREFQSGWEGARQRGLSRTRFMEIIGRKYGLKRRGAINAIERGLNRINSPPPLPFPRFR